MAVEGDSEIARRQQSFMDDGVIDRDEKREMNKAHRRALESRGRGMAQVGAYRSVKWMGRGLYDRLPGRKKTRERKCCCSPERVVADAKQRRYRPRHKLEGHSKRTSGGSDTHAPYYGPIVHEHVSS